MTRLKRAPGQSNSKGRLRLHRTHRRPGFSSGRRTGYTVRVLVATWNVNGLRARLDFVLHWLRARRPDVVGLQELKLTEEQFPFDEFAREGYRALVHGQKAWNGVAILSRGPAEPHRRELPGDPSGEARLISARLGPLTFATLYCPNGKSTDHPDFVRKLHWLDALQRFVEQSLDASRSTLLCGDFNICPTPLDSWNEEALRGTVFHTEEERSRFRRLLDWGFHDLFREKHPDTRAYSWWDYRGGSFHKDEGLRIDLLLGTAPLLKSLRRVEIDREYRKKKEGLTASDHAPVLAEFDA
jgi:exodeoxyribonuclease III